MILSAVTYLTSVALVQGTRDEPLVPRRSANLSSVSASYFPWEMEQLSSSQISTLFSNLTAKPLAVGQCKVFPGDASWPSDSTWAAFNASLKGALIRTIPVAAPCWPQWSEYDEVKCAEITAAWSTPQLHVADPTSTQWPLFQGRTCQPPSVGPPYINNCTIGGYAVYSVNVSTVAQVQTTFSFSIRHKLRLNIKNTGHDFADKGMGAGALSLWTHNLNDLEFYKSYTHGDYTGPAWKLAAGVDTEMVYESAEANNVTAVGGECRTVGLAGGYIAGGGHSPMSSAVGLAADQILSMEVVLLNGEFVTVDATHKPDLFWALRGVGGSTLGLVTSIVIRAYPQVTVSTMTFSFSTGPNVTADTFWEAMRAFMSYYTAFVDAGTYSYFLTQNTGNQSFSFTFDPFWGLNHSIPELKALVAPFLEDLADLGIAVDPIFTQYSSMYPAWNASFPPEKVGSSTGHAGSRLFPRENFENGTLLNETLAAVRYAVENGGLLVGYNIRAASNSAPGVNQTNAVNPAWRKTATHFILSAGFANNASIPEIQNVGKTLTKDWMARWRAVSPNAGAYMSEGDINEPDFQQSFFGSYYPTLYAMKQKYDPTSLLYAPQGVGSEDWTVTNQIEWLPTQNGRLCRVG